MTKRILCVIPCRFFGGPEKQTVQTACTLRQRYGHEIAFAVMPYPDSPPEQNPLIRAAHDRGFLVFPFVMRLNHNIFEGISILRSLVRQYEPDVVCTIGYKANLFSALGVDRPKVAVLHGWTSQDWKVRLYEWLDTRTLRRHSAILIVSETQRGLLQQLGVDPNLVYWSPNAIDVSSLVDPAEKDEILQAFGGKPSYLVGSVGRLSPEKGHRFLIEAASYLISKFPDIGIVLVGDGSELAKLMQMVYRIGLQDKIKFLGFRSDAQRIIGTLDLLVLPSVTEAMPVVILEAFAYKTPVVATAVGGVPGLVKDRETGWLVPPRDPHALAQAIREALSNPEEARRRAENAYRHLLENFTVEKQAEAWDRALQAAVENWKRRRR